MQPEKDDGSDNQDVQERGHHSAEPRCREGFITSGAHARAPHDGHRPATTVLTVITFGPSCKQRTFDDRVAERCTGSTHPPF